MSFFAPDNYIETELISLSMFVTFLLSICKSSLYHDVRHICYISMHASVRSGSTAILVCGRSSKIYKFMDVVLAPYGD